MDVQASGQGVIGIVVGGGELRLRSLDGRRGGGDVACGDAREDSEGVIDGKFDDEAGRGRRRAAPIAEVVAQSLSACTKQCEYFGATDQEETPDKEVSDKGLDNDSSLLDEQS